MIRAGFVEAKELVAAPPIKAVRMRKAPNDPSARGWKRPRMAGEDRSKTGNGRSSHQSTKQREPQALQRSGMAGKVTDRRLSVAEVATDRQIEGASPERAAAPQGAPAEGAAGAPAIGNGRMGMAGEATERENGGSSVLRGRSNLRGSSDLRRRSVGTEGGEAAAPSCETTRSSAIQ
jgi:hypothetical protein